MDLGHEQRRCEVKLTSLLAEQCDLEGRCQRLAEKQKVLPLHLKQRTAESEHYLREVCPFLNSFFLSSFCYDIVAESYGLWSSKETIFCSIAAILIPNLAFGD